MLSYSDNVSSVENEEQRYKDASLWYTTKNGRSFKFDLFHNSATLGVPYCTSISNSNTIGQSMTQLGPNDDLKNSAARFSVERDGNFVGTSSQSSEEQPTSNLKHRWVNIWHFQLIF